MTGDRLSLSVAEELAEHRQAMAPGERLRGEEGDVDHRAAGISGGVSMSASRLSDIRTAATLTEFRPRCA